MQNLIVNKKKCFKIFRIINRKRDETIISSNTSYTFIEALNEQIILKIEKCQRERSQLQNLKTFVKTF